MIVEFDLPGGVVVGVGVDDLLLRGDLSLAARELGRQCPHGRQINEQRHGQETSQPLSFSHKYYLLGEHVTHCA